MAPVGQTSWRFASNGVPISWAWVIKNSSSGCTQLILHHCPGHKSSSLSSPPHTLSNNFTLIKLYWVVLKKSTPIYPFSQFSVRTFTGKASTNLSIDWVNFKSLEGKAMFYNLISSPTLCFLSFRARQYFPTLIWREQFRTIQITSVHDVCQFEQNCANLWLKLACKGRPRPVWSFLLSWCHYFFKVQMHKHLRN